MQFDGAPWLFNQEDAETNHEAYSTTIELT
jgi:hypothetical protein